jgi:hypothetical protein
MKTKIKNKNPIFKTSILTLKINFITIVELTRFFFFFFFFNKVDITSTIQKHFLYFYNSIVIIMYEVNHSCNPTIHVKLFLWLLLLFV